MKYYILLGLFVLGLSAASGVYYYGKRSAVKEQVIQQLDNYKTTRERIDEANKFNPDVNAAREYLRLRQQRKDSSK